MKFRLILGFFLFSAIVINAQEVKPLGENETINFEFLENNWEVVMVAFDNASISGENLKHPPHYFTMKMGEYGNFYHSNLDYETATFGYNTNVNSLNITTSKGGEVTNQSYWVRRLEKESLVIQDPFTETLYYLAPITEEN
jgi:hypothetical protein